jgi:hypothetical protein
VRTAATLVPLGTNRPRSRAALELAARQLEQLTTTHPVSLRFTGYEPFDGQRVGRYEADYPDDTP